MFDICRKFSSTKMAIKCTHSNCSTFYMSPIFRIITSCFIQTGCYLVFRLPLLVHWHLKHYLRHVYQSVYLPLELLNKHIFCVFFHLWCIICHHTQLYVLGYNVLCIIESYRVERGCYWPKGLKHLVKQKKVSQILSYNHRDFYKP